MQIQNAQGGPNTTQTGTDPVWYDFTARYASAERAGETPASNQKSASSIGQPDRTPKPAAEQSGVMLNGQTKLGIVDALVYTMASMFDQ